MNNQNGGPADAETQANIDYAEGFITSDERRNRVARARAEYAAWRAWRDELDTPRDRINEIVDMLGCTRAQAQRMDALAQRPGEEH